MYELIIACIAVFSVCQAHVEAPQPGYVRVHYTRAQCITELDRVVVLWDEGPAAYRFLCRAIKSSPER